MSSRGFSYRPNRMDKVTASILPALEAAGGFWWATHGPDSRPLKKGIPDIMGLRRGKLWCFECKRPKEKRSPEQEAFAAHLAEHGIEVHRVETIWEALQAIEIGAYPQ